MAEIADGVWVIDIATGSGGEDPAFVLGESSEFVDDEFGFNLIRGIALHPGGEFPGELPPVLPAFFSHPLEEDAIHIIGGSDVEISEKSFLGQDVVAIIVDGVTNVYIHDIDFADCIGCVFLAGCDGQIRIEDIRARNTGIHVDFADPEVTLGSGKSNVIQLAYCQSGGGLAGIRRVIAFGGHTEDMISMFESGGVNSGNPFIIEDNHLQSPLTGSMSYASGSGSGINAADGPEGLSQFTIVRKNTVLDAGQCGIQNFSGSGIKIRENVVIHRNKLRSNTGIYMPWAGGLFGGGYGDPVTDNECSDNRILWDTNLNGNRMFLSANGTFYPSEAETCIFHGMISTPNPPTGLSPQTNILQDSTLVPSEYEIVQNSMVYIGPQEMTWPALPNPNGTAAAITGPIVSDTGLPSSYSSTFLTLNQCFQYLWNAGFHTALDLQVGAAIAIAESSRNVGCRNWHPEYGFRPLAESPIHLMVTPPSKAWDPNGNTSGKIMRSDRGVWQISDHWYPQYTDAWCDDPAIAARIVYLIQTQVAGGWNQWDTYANGDYLGLVTLAQAQNWINANT